MSPQVLRAKADAREMRRAFDRAFADAPGSEAGARVDLLAIRLGADAYAIRLSEVAGLFMDTPIVRFPGAPPAQLGLVGLRGTIVPVFDLRRLVGYQGGTACRWLLTAAAARVALAFDRFEGHYRVLPDSIAAAPAGARRIHASHIAHMADGAQPVLDLAAILAAVRQLAMSSPR